MGFLVVPLLGFSISRVVLIFAAVIPAVILLRRVYKSDRLEPENPSTIKHLVIMGIISTFIAVMCERLGSGILNLFFRKENLVYDFLLYFVVVGLSEEAAKYTILSRETWNSPEFNCKYDGIVFAVSVSLGFALWENIGYVLQLGLSTALLRAVTAVPGHASFGVFMGVWYGMAKRCALQGDAENEKRCKRLAVIMPAVVHGFYDFIATMDSEFSSYVFIAFVALIFVVSYWIVRRLSEHDQYL